MTIAFDIDGTWSRAPEMWIDVANMMARYGHRPIIVTGRDKWSPDIDRMKLWSLEIHYCGRTPKEEFMKSKGITVDVWIDNEPWLICPSKQLQPAKDEDL